MKAKKYTKNEQDFSNKMKEKRGIKRLTNKGMNCKQVHTITNSLQWWQRERKNQKPKQTSKYGQLTSASSKAHEAILFIFSIWSVKNTLRKTSTFFLKPELTNTYYWLVSHWSTVSSLLVLDICDIVGIQTSTHLIIEWT